MLNRRDDDGSARFQTEIQATKRWFTPVNRPGDAAGATSIGNGNVVMGMILVIDDEQGITTLIQEALQMFGHQVEIAMDGHEGIRKFERNRYDLVITDIRMPGMDGNSVARHIRKSDRNATPIIGMSGTPWLSDTGDFDMVLSKPFPLKTLIESLAHLPRSTHPAHPH